MGPIIRLFAVVCCLCVVSANFIVLRDVKGENSTEELLEKWRKLDKFLTDTIGQVAENILPQVIRLSSEVELSSECTTTLLKLLLGIRQQKPWAMNMLDSSGKISSGLLGGTLSDFGNYDDCLDLVHLDSYSGEVSFQGQYCTVEFRPALPKKPNNYRYTESIPILLQNFTAHNEYTALISKFPQMFYFVFIRLGVCIPSSCPIEDLRSITNYVGKLLGGYCDVSRCDIKGHTEITTLQWIAIGVLVFLCLLCLIGSIVGYFYKEKKLSIGLQLITSFSVPENVKRLLDTTRPPTDVIPVLDGIRFLSIAWVVLGHTYLFINWQTLRHFRQAEKKGFVGDFAFQAIMSGFLSVPSFFFISGLLVSFLTMKHVFKEGKSVFNIPIFVIRRVWRLLPSTMLLVVLTFLLPLVGSGPIWHETTDVLVDTCKTNWWTNFLFFNNYLYPSEQCQCTTWFTACELQLYLVGLIFLALVIWKTAVGFFLLVVLVIFSIVSVGFITYWYDLLPTILFISPDPEVILNFWHYIHFKPHTHVGPYAIGLGMGYLFALKKTPKITKIQKCAGWLVAIAFGMLATYGTYDWNTSRAPTRVESILYAAFHRPIWVLAVAWMTYACSNNFGGAITSILSWRGFIPLSRLTFLVYLWHATIIWFYMGNLRGQIDTSHVTLVWIFLGCLSVSLAVAFVTHVLVESPFAQLQKIVLDRKRHSPTREEYDLEKTKNIRDTNGSIVYKM